MINGSDFSQEDTDISNERWIMLLYAKFLRYNIKWK